MCFVSLYQLSNYILTIQQLISAVTVTRVQFSFCMYFWLVACFLCVMTCVVFSFGAKHLYTNITSLLDYSIALQNVFVDKVITLAPLITVFCSL